MRIDLAAILLAGGQSRRMGRDKALLDIGGKPVIQRVADTLLQCTPHVCLAASDQHSYDFLHLPVAADDYPGLGPLAGLYAGMKHIDATWYILAACDMPFASASLIRLMMKTATMFGDSNVEEGQIPLAQAAFPSYEGRIHPLYALYHRTVLPSLQTALEQRQLKVMDWLEQHNQVEIPLEQLLKEEQDEHERSYDLTPWCLYNMNDPEAYEMARRLYILKQMPGN
ncbi:molybdenum cofactor guanylyltransferase [Paenibacillus campi]|uniref:molybdenum cofactor guanylyltransferase n=1 Tax=Paenibacillus campi TaxID=3106031 RepID=UPI002AFF549B|nr:MULTISPECIES: molybdenum cofactor guanylyltransferase [unclassified Paenibacillus]